MRIINAIVVFFVVAMCCFQQGTCVQQALVAADLCKPEQTHISHGTSTEEMVIIWSTSGSCSAHVKYGSGPFQLSSSEVGESKLLYGAYSSSEQRYIHKASLKNLSPETVYYYMPVSNDTSAGPYYFQTPRKLKENIEFMVFSDLSTSSPAISGLVQEVLTGKYAALLHLGNIAMNLSSQNGTNGDHYLNLMEQAIRTVPYLTAPGPNEVEGDSYSQYALRFSASGEWPMKAEKLWYSIDIGPVHLISYSTEVFYLEKGKNTALQHDWLIMDLKIANSKRNEVPWIIAFGHRPMYCTYEDPNLACNPKITKNSPERIELEDIFYHYGVDVVIQSYGGAYERTFPMYKGVQLTDNYTNPLGPVHVISGGASLWNIEHNFTSPAPVWSAFRYINDSALSYGRIQIVNSSILTYKQICVTNGSVIDSFEIIQEKHGEFTTDKLPPNITAKIDRERVDAGGKPGTLNIEEIGVTSTKSQNNDLISEDNKIRLFIGVGCAALVFVSIITIIFVKAMRKKKKTTRRWEQMDINYGKKFYSKAPDKDEDNDFEIDMSDGTEPTRKLLTADD